MRKMRKFRDYLIETLQDPEEATAYLQVTLEEYMADNNTEAFLLALRTVAEAHGGLQEIAKRNLTSPRIDTATAKGEKTDATSKTAEMDRPNCH